MKRSRASLGIIFTTVLVDLIGFGMVIPLISLYGRHYGAGEIELAVLGGIYSLMQFFFAPVWGSLSDRFGRRPILLLSLAGSTLAYLQFGLAGSFTALLISRAFGGVFAANISAAQAYIADITTPADRAKGMGLIGAAFGLGFTLGPPLGGIASAKLGLAAPGLLAAALCGLNFLLACVRLPESLPKEKRARALRAPGFSLSPQRLREIAQFPKLPLWLALFFGVTFAFTHMEQTFSLLFQTRFGFETGDAGYRTGLILMWAGLIGAALQGGAIRKLAPRFGEWKLLVAGLVLNVIGMAIFPWGASYASYFAIILPLAIGSSLVNPALSALISRSAPADRQGVVMGISQGLGSLARAVGPFCGLLAFSAAPFAPYVVASALSLVMLVFALRAGTSHARAITNS